MDNITTTITFDNKTYDISHLSIQDKKDIFTLVQTIQDISRDIAVCSSNLSKNALRAYVSLYKGTFSLLVDVDCYKTIKGLLNK